MFEHLSGYSRFTQSTTCVYLIRSILVQSSVQAGKDISPLQSLSLIGMTPPHQALIGMPSHQAADMNTIPPGISLKYYPTRPLIGTPSHQAGLG
ncbi:hypothetical protein XELAEV_18031409mg [Xenopus laevis]|uniref:Uncharacterized protein n=1 Tax=Xenopus laevis TaxID=8355 RepID=A0A974CNB2_XENLA|nr:hypothetical protein XELAEV_18031409mg [Xenopus laevis]